MAEIRICDACAMEFDWEGLEAEGYQYCCDACSRGEPCTCPQHHHEYATDQPLNRAAASQLGTTGP